MHKILSYQVSQKVSKSQRRKKSWNFVYYLAKQCKSPFLLTKRIQNSKLAQFEISIFNRKKKKFGKKNRYFFANCFQIIFASDFLVTEDLSKIFFRKIDSNVEIFLRFFDDFFLEELRNSEFFFRN